MSIAVFGKLAGTIFSVVAVCASARGATQSEIMNERREIDPSEISIMLERTTCLGSCPEYRVTISGTGEVEYNGNRYVKTVGRRSGKLDRARVLNLTNELLRLRFFDLPDEYVMLDTITEYEGRLFFGQVYMTDGPSAILTFKLGEHAKRIVLYAHYPEALGRVPTLIDELVDIEQWIGTTCERPRSSIGPHPQPGECEV